MGWLRKFVSWQNTPVMQNEPSVTFSHEITTPRPIDEAILEWRGGARASRDEALRVPAVLRGRNLLCSIATLPLETRNENSETVKSQFLGQIDPSIANVVTLARTVEDLVFEAEAWWRVLSRNFTGRIMSAEHVQAELVTPDTDERFVWVDGVKTAMTQMIRFDSPNPGVLDYAGRAIKRAATFEKSATNYANDPRANDYFTPSEGADPVDDDEVEDLLNDWAKARRRRSTAYVPAALQYNTIDAMTPADLQLVDLQKQVAIEISNVLGIDPEDLGVSTTSRTYANAVDRRRDRVNDTLSPYMLAITDRLSMDDITVRGHRVQFNLDDYLKADAKTRWETHKTALETGAVTIQEVREKEDLPEIPVEQPRRPTPPVPREAPAVNSTLPVTANFANEPDAIVAFEMDEPTAAFRVNKEKRTISGLLIPWGKVGRSMGRSWQFNTDSLHWSDVSRIKANRDHNRSQTVAVATRLQNTPTGLDGSFRVARGDDGDRVLSLAEDGILDGFSVEVDFADGDQITENDEGTVVVSRGTLRGVAITSNPAFDDARVTSVAATREGSQNMKCSKCGHVHAPTVACTAADPAVQTTDDGATTAAFTAALETQSANFTTAVEALTGVATKLTEAMEQPTPIDKNTAKFKVNEEKVYRFDGTRGKHDFSADLIAMSKKDHEAEKRVVDFIKEAFASASAEFVQTGDVNELNPVQQRPGMYVDQLQYPTPLWDSMNKGTLPDNTPFVLPKFATAANLVGDHTEGVEPGVGSFTTTSQTITPSAVSGKVEVTREAWDQGGNPQLSTILWRQIVREYYEALEEAAAAMLNALTATEVTLTAAAVDGALASEIKQALADLHFIRGGFRFRDFKLAADLYTALADANDTTGRPLFPILGANNADGQMGPLFGSISVAGLAGTPAWALPNTVEGTPDVPSKSYLYNREDVHGWASAPQRLDFEYRVAFVDIGVWGYKALAATREAEVRRINYDVSPA